MLNEKGYNQKSIYFKITKTKIICLDLVLCGAKNQFQFNFYIPDPI
jgi:hypothetical protein